MRLFERRLLQDAGVCRLLALIDQLNRDPHLHGILMHLALPLQSSSSLVADTIEALKDASGFHMATVTMVSMVQPALAHGAQTSYGDRTVWAAQKNSPTGRIGAHFQPATGRNSRLDRGAALNTLGLQRPFSVEDDNR